MNAGALDDSESVGVTGLLGMGFVVEGTGGGCTALVLECGDGARIYVTDGDGNAPDATDHEWSAGVEMDEEWTEEECVGSPAATLACIRLWADDHTPMVCDECRSYGPQSGCDCGGAQ